MDHGSSLRLVPGADTAVVFIHGIAGTPRHFDELLPLTALVPETYSVCNLLLPGHGGAVRDFSSSGMKQWREYALEAVEALCRTHSKIVLVGHSMGTLFSIEAACRWPEKITALVLLAVPLCPRVKLSASVRMLRLCFGCLREDIATDYALMRACGVEPTWKLWEYAGWIPGFLGLLAQIYRTGRMLQEMSTQAYVFQSAHDELVSKYSQQLLRRNPCIDVHVLPNSGHFYYAPNDETFIRNKFIDLMDEIKKHD